MLPLFIFNLTLIRPEHISALIESQKSSIKLIFFDSMFTNIIYLNNPKVIPNLIIILYLIINLYNYKDNISYIIKNKLLLILIIVIKTIILIKLNH